jgi:hypothetical protein
LNKECLYLHFQADNLDIIDRDDMNTNKSIFLSQHYLAIELGEILQPEMKKFLESTKGNITYFPTPSIIYDKDMVETYSAQTYSCSKGNLFKTSGRSRFGFNNGEELDSTQNDSIEVPDFICNILNKNLSRYSHFKSCDDSFLDQKVFKFPSSHPWAEFMTSLNGEFINLAKFNSA